MSLWPGLVQTELVKEQMEKGDQSKDPTMKLVGTAKQGVWVEETLGNRSVLPQRPDKKPQEPMVLPTTAQG